MLIIRYLAKGTLHYTVFMLHCSVSSLHPTVSLLYFEYNIITFFCCFNEIMLHL